MTKARAGTREAAHRPRRPPRTTPHKRISDGVNASVVRTASIKYGGGMSTALTAKSHGTRSTGSVRTLTTASVCCVIWLLSASLHGQSSEPVFPNPGHVGMSRDQQRQLGLQVAAQV